MVKPYDLDIASLSRAVESLISKTKTSLGVADTPAPNPSSEGSGTKARYNFAVDASVSLSNRWDIVEGLVLIDVSLRLRAEKRSGEEGGERSQASCRGTPAVEVALCNVPPADSL